MNRRQFLKTSLAIASTSQLNAEIEIGKTRLSGVQISPHSLFDEGIESCLDFLQEKAGINALFLYSQTYHLGTRPANVLANDHPSPAKNPQGRKLPFLWVDFPSKPFESLTIRHETRKKDHEYGDRDIFEELIEPCRKRGIRIYPRILEAGMRRADRIPGYTSVAAKDLDGSPSHGPCWNHPEYREWIRLTIDEMMKTYPVDGLQYGAERVGALSEVLFRGMKPACFCEHCNRRNQEKGIDPKRALTGYRKLYQLVKQLEVGNKPGSDGVMTAILRVLFEYPEILTWYREWFKADQEIQTLVYETAKKRRPHADVGQHVDHQRSSWDLFYRAAVSYDEMATHNDFIKPIVYHDILGPRMKEWVIDRMQTRILGDFNHEQSLNIFYGLFGHSEKTEPAYSELMNRGFSPEYVYQEIKRCVDGANGKARVYAGIGFDVPTYTATGMEKFPSRPDNVTKAVRRALDAGAAGVVASREYDEMTLPNLQAFKRGFSV